MRLLILLTTCLFCLAACGQKGALYIPADNLAAPDTEQQITNGSL